MFHPQLLCADVDLEKLLHMDALNHPALNETSKDSATHHFCHVEDPIVVQIYYNPITSWHLIR